MSRKRFFFLDKSTSTQNNKIHTSSILDTPYALWDCKYLYNKVLLKRTVSNASLPVFFWGKRRNHFPEMLEDIQFHRGLAERTKEGLLAV